MRGVLILAAAVLLAGCGSSSKQPDESAVATARAQRAAHEEVAVTIGAKTLTADEQEVPSETQVAVRLTSTTPKKTDVKLLNNGTLIGEATGVQAGHDFSVIIPHLQPGKLVIKAGARKTTLKVGAAP